MTLPDWEALTAGLAALLGGVGAAAPVTLLGRAPNPDAGTFPSETVTCRLSDGRTVTLFCKYGARHPENPGEPHGGVGYEAEVYRRILQPLGPGTVRFYGAHVGQATGDTWLVLEALDGSLPTHRAASQTEALRLAARWIGRFHATVATPAASSAGTEMPTLKVFDGAYYRQWARQTTQFAGGLRKEYPWLETVCGRFEVEMVPLLLAAPDVIHGDYYADNVLYREGRVYPVDWAWAAVGAGEIDLAALTERWPEETARVCEAEYQCARWPDGTPADFPHRLDAARLYLLLRWLGHRPEWAADPRRRWRYEALRSASGRLWGYCE